VPGFNNCFIDDQSSVFKNAPGPFPFLSIRWTGTLSREQGPLLPPPPQEGGGQGNNWGFVLRQETTYISIGISTCTNGGTYLGQSCTYSTQCTKAANALCLNGRCCTSTGTSTCTNVGHYLGSTCSTVSQCTQLTSQPV